MNIRANAKANAKCFLSWPVLSCAVMLFCASGATPASGDGTLSGAENSRGANAFATQIPSSNVAAVSEAGRAYDSGDYAKAVDLYEAVVARGVVNGTILYNLGAAYYRLEKIGEAVAAFRGASRFLPRDADVAANLEYARKRRTDIVENKKGPLAQLLFWAEWASLREYLAASSTFLTALLAWILARRRVAAMPLWLAIVSAAFAMVALFTTTAKFLGWVDEPAGVVVVPEVSVKSGNADANVTLFVLHAGTEVALAEKRGDWVQISLGDGRKGWVREEFLKRVAEDSL